MSKVVITYFGLLLTGLLKKKNLFALGWGLQSSHHRGLSLPQLPDSSPIKSETKNSTVSSVVITKVSTESEGTSSSTITSIPVLDPGLKPLLVRPVDQSDELQSGGTRNQSKFHKSPSLSVRLLFLHT